MIYSGFKYYYIKYIRFVKCIHNDSNENWKLIIKFVSF